MPCIFTSNKKSINFPKKSKNQNAPRHFTLLLIIDTINYLLFKSGNIISVGGFLSICTLLHTHSPPQIDKSKPEEYKYEQNNTITKKPARRLVSS